jgi:fatty-acid desaturase
MLSLIAFCAALYLLASARPGLARGQFDWTRQIVRLLRALGLETEVRTAPETDP